jgi:membrane-associated protease RseP (regulator of RpoE activity)
MGLDEQVVRPTDSEFRQLRDQFVVVRILEMKNLDIARFQFDYDLVFAIVFMNAHGEVYSRYGGRTPWNPESRISLAGLKYTMRQVLDAHQPDRRPKQDSFTAPLIARDLFPHNRSCIHCHEVWEGLRNRARREGTFDARSLFVYPMPENIGLKLSVDAGNQVIHVKPESASARAGLMIGDTIQRIGVWAILSQADVAWALHNAPESGTLSVAYVRSGAVHKTDLYLKAGWRQTNLSWRASMRKEQLPPRTTAADPPARLHNGVDWSGVRR